MNKCSGCGDLISDDKKLCERCFRITHYNEYKTVVKSNEDFEPILNRIKYSNDLVILVVDLFNFYNLDKFNDYLNDNVVLVLTKRDLLPLPISEDKLLNYDYKIDYRDKVIVSSNNNYGLDNLFNLISGHSKVYFIGYTNSGKSTLINKLIYNYGNRDVKITTSPLPSTTLDLIEIKLNDNLTLIDTPGLLNEGDITNFIEPELLTKIIPKNEIMPITYQIKDRQTLIIEELLRIDSEKTNITLFFSNNVTINRYYKEVNTKHLGNKKSLFVKKGEDIVISGLGFIKVNKDSELVFHTLNGVSIEIRKSLI